MLLQGLNRCLTRGLLTIVLSCAAGSPARGDTITGIDFTLDPLNSATATGLFSDPNSGLAANEAVVHLAYAVPNIIDMHVMMDGVAGSLIITEHITNNTEFDWGDFSWELFPNNPDPNEGLVYSQILDYTGPFTDQLDQVGVGTGLLKFDEGRLLRGDSMTIKYQLTIPAGTTFYTSSHYDVPLAVLPEPSALVRLLSLAIPGVVLMGYRAKRRMRYL